MVAGQFHTTVSGVSTMKVTNTTSWNRKQPSPGPRSGSRSSPLYWTGPVVGRGLRGGVGSDLGFGGKLGAAGAGSKTGSGIGSAGSSVTGRNDT